MNAVLNLPNGADVMVTLPMTELQRQERALKELGSDYQFPLFNGRQALESQRKSGYKTTARAAREIVDNAYEAGATKCWIVLDRPPEQGRNKSQRRDAVSAIAFVDNGPGMLRNMVRYALSWGGGTRFDSPTGIGRFGFGLPNASINQTQRVEVYSRTHADEPWYRAVLDITPQRLSNVPPTGLVSVDPVEDAKLPGFVERFLENADIQLSSATIVVWDKPDRLTVRSAGRLREHLLEDFGVVYRNLLSEFNLVVDGVPVKPVDPLFLTPGAAYYLPPEDGGAERTFDRNLPVKYSRDPDTGAQHLQLLESAEDLALARQDLAATVSVITVVVSRFPYGFAAERYKGKQVEKDTDAYRRLQIRKKRRGVSYVRAKREIDYVDYFPTLNADSAAGLGHWPTVQGYGMHWGMEVRFGPELDDAFGIGNDKQTVSPIEDVWRVFAAAEIDRAVGVEQAFQRREREKAKEQAAAEQVSNPDATNPAIEAAQEAEAIIGARPLPDERVVESQERLKETVEERQRQTGQPKTDVEEAIQRETARKRFGIEFFESQGGVFMRPDWGNGLQKIAKINRAHPFFKVFYTHVAMLSDPKPRQALDLLLMALAKSELEAVDTGKRVAEHLREQVWSPFLKAGYDSLEAMQVTDPEENEEDVPPEEA